jgi:hypothetical protein
MVRTSVLQSHAHCFGCERNVHFCSFTPLRFLAALFVNLSEQTILYSPTGQYTT